jgi:hypothetical protein
LQRRGQPFPHLLTLRPNGRVRFHLCAVGDDEPARSYFSGALGEHGGGSSCARAGLPRALDPSPAAAFEHGRRADIRAVMIDDPAALQKLVETADRVLRNLDESADPRYPGIEELRQHIVAVRDEALLKFGPVSQSALLLLLAIWS